MTTKKKPSIEKPLTNRQQAELTIYAGLISGTAVQVLNADNGEVYAKLADEAKHAFDVFLASHGVVGERS
jgi:hypothetical protein